ncbi:MAG: hypothetical protein RJQ00_07595 [Vicingaceae bacterium]
MIVSITLIKRILYFLSVILVFSSCNLYKPTALNTPILKEKGDLTVALSTVNSTDLLVNYAVSDNIAIQANVATAYQLEITSEVNGEERSASFPNYKYDIGLAYFNETSTGDNLLVGVGYAGGEMGTLINDEDDFVGLVLTEGAFGASFNAGYIQSNYFIDIGDDFYFGICGRLNYLTFNEFDYSFIFSDTSTFSESFTPKDHSALIGQLGAEIKYNGDKVGAFAQLNTAFDSNNEKYFTTRRLSLHVGVSFRLDEIFNF